MQGDQSGPTFAQFMDRLKQWRHLPSYQLERRLDIFLTPYLCQIIEAEKKSPIQGVIIPEFPIWLKTMKDLDTDPKCDGLWCGDDHRSIKVDYLVLQKDLECAYLIEFKTDPRFEKSRHALRQARAMSVLNGQRFQRVVEGVLQIGLSENASPKYFHLLKLMISTGLLACPKDLEESSTNLAELRGCKELAVADKIAETVIQTCYIRPGAISPDDIGLERVADLLKAKWSGDGLAVPLAELLLDIERDVVGDDGSKACPICSMPATSHRGLVKHLMGTCPYGGHEMSKPEAERLLAERREE